MLFPGADVRTRVYVDGFNLYYGALKGTPFKWLDPVRLAAHLLPREHADAFWLIFEGSRPPMIRRRE